MNRRAVLASVLAICIAALGASATLAVARPNFVAYGSCDLAKPFDAAKHCRFDRPEHARATFIFRSNVGPRALRVCQRITGLSFHGRQCLKAKKPTSRETIPFELKGAYRRFKVIVTFYAHDPGSSGHFRRVARAALAIAP
jgi:hypothetical protein